MSQSDPTRERIERMVQENTVLLFMKGQRDAPQCGFSAQVVAILDRLLPSYTTFDVLSDPEVREGVKEFSEWPTIPQLYARGEFVGGCDIITEMYEAGELHEALGRPQPKAEAPRVTVTDAAAEALQRAQERQPDSPLHLSIDGRFRYGLGFGPRQANEIEVRAGAFTFLLDPDSAARADGLVIDAVDSPQGPRLSIQNPNEPQVGQMTAGELDALRRSGREHRLLDVRTPEEREKAHIEGAVLLTPQVRAELEALPRDTLLVFHCHHGGRSQAAAQELACLGFTNVYNLQGGIDAWSREVDSSVPTY